MVNKARAIFQDGILRYLVARSKACVYGRSLAGFVGLKPAGGMDSLVSVVCCQVQVTDHLSRGVLPSVVCLGAIVKPRQCGGPGQLGAVAPRGEGGGEYRVILRNRSQNCHVRLSDVTSLPAVESVRYGSNHSTRLQAYLQLPGLGSCH